MFYLMINIVLKNLRRLRSAQTEAVAVAVAVAVTSAVFIAF